MSLPVPSCFQLAPSFHGGPGISLWRNSPGPGAPVAKLVQWVNYDLCWTYRGFLSHRGTPSHHPFGIFPPFGVPPCMETDISTVHGCYWGLWKNLKRSRDLPVCTCRKRLAEPSFIRRSFEEFRAWVWDKKSRQPWEARVRSDEWSLYTVVRCGEIVILGTERRQERHTHTKPQSLRESGWCQDLASVQGA